MAVLKDLIVHGRSRFINGIDADTIEANAIKADSGIFNQLIATTLEAKNASIDELTANNATVFGVMDVKGKLQTNQWEAASIANIGGNFYISPTGKSSSGTVTITRTSVATSTAAAKYSVAMSGTFDVGTTSSTVWVNGAYGMATGNVSVGTKKYPLGTCDGPLSDIGTGTNTITGFTISNVESAALDIIFDENASLISNNAISGQSGTDLQVSVYLGKSGSNYMPVGILLTSYGKDNKQYIDIYDGGHSAGTSITGFADPVVRIGDLNGLNSYTQANKYTITPSGWGIYTSNGYFKGAVYAEQGYIGGFTIGNTDLFNSKTSLTGSTAGIFISTTGIAGGAGDSWWIKSDGTFQFGGTSGVRYDGITLTVPAANVSGALSAATIDASKITSGDIAAARIQTNLITAINAKVSDISALTATLGGFQVDSTAIHTNGVAITSNADNSIALSSADFTRTINSISRAGLRFAIGDKFGVTGDGIIYASEAVISGAINAATLSTGTKTTSTTGTGTYIDGTGAIYSGSGTENNFIVSNTGALTVKSGTIGGWSIGADSIYKQSSGLDSNGRQYQALLYAPDTISSSNWAFRVRYRTNTSSNEWTTPFYVSYGGAVGVTSMEAFDENHDSVGVFGTSIRLGSLGGVNMRLTPTSSVYGAIAFYERTDIGGYLYVNEGSIQLGAGSYTSNTANYNIWLNRYSVTMQYNDNHYIEIDNSGIYMGGATIHEGHIRPEENATYQLGTSEYGWAKVIADYVWMGRGGSVGSLTVNHGIYSSKLSKWLLYGDSSQTTRVFTTSVSGDRFCPGRTSSNGSNGVYLGDTTYTWNKYYGYSADSIGSDRKIKDDIHSISYAKDLIMQLEPVEYYLKGSDYNRRHMGFIAQDVAKIGKSINQNLSVYEANYKDETKGKYQGEDVDDSELTWTLAYTELIAPLVQVVQDQQQEIEQLKKEVAQLKNK